MEYKAPSGSSYDMDLTETPAEREYDPPKLTHLEMRAGINCYVVPHFLGFSISLLCLSRNDNLSCPFVHGYH